MHKLSLMGKGEGRWITNHHTCQWGNSKTMFHVGLLLIHFNLIPKVYLINQTYNTMDTYISVVCGLVRVLRIGTKKMSDTRDWIMCSNNNNHSRLNSQHDLGGTYMTT